MDLVWQQFTHHFSRPLTNPVLVFGVILLIILLSPLLLRKVRVPSIIGLIISGVVIGPNALNLIAKNAAVDLFSTIGLLYVMFIAGLELDMNEFRQNRYRGILFGFLTFALPFACGFAVGFYLLKMNFQASLLIALVVAPHTLVSYGVLAKFNAQKDPSVAVSVSGTILADTVALVMLNIVRGATRGELDAVFWTRLGVLLAIFSVIMFFVIPRVSKWFFSAVENERTSHYIFVLSIVFICAFLAEAAGLEPIIGAFTAGLAINRLIPHSSVLMNRIDFIGHALFIPFFLISVGMLVDPKVLVSGPRVLIVSFLLIAAATVSKYAAAWLAQLILGYTKIQRRLMFGLTLAHAATTLAVILIGFNLGLVGEDVLNAAVIVILVTCIHASFATESAAKAQFLASENAEVHAETATADNFLIASSNPESTQRLIECALLLKDAKLAGDITLLSVVLNNDNSDAELKKARERLEKAILSAGASDTKIKTRVTLDVNAADGIVRAGKEFASSVIFLGASRRSSILETFFASKAQSVLRSTDRMLMLCRFMRALPTHSRLLLLCPPLVERDGAFEIWWRRIVKLASELSLPIVALCNASTHRALEAALHKLRVTVKLECYEYTDWENYRSLGAEFGADDIIVFIAARKGTVAYAGSASEEFQQRAGRSLDNKSYIVLYPPRAERSGVFDEYDDVDPDAIGKGLRAVRILGRRMKRLFRAPKP